MKAAIATGEAQNCELAYAQALPRKNNAGVVTGLFRTIAYVINKSATFNKRSAVTDSGTSPKREKDC